MMKKNKAALSLLLFAMASPMSAEEIQVPVSKNLSPSPELSYLDKAFSQQIIEQKNSAINSLNNERQRYEWLINKLNSNLQNLKEYLKNSQETVEKLKIELDSQKRKNDDMSLALQEEMREKDQLRATISSLEGQIDFREKTIEELIVYIESAAVTGNSVVREFPE